MSDDRDSVAYDIETGTTETGRYNPVMQIAMTLPTPDKKTIEWHAWAGMQYVSPGSIAVNGLSPDNAPQGPLSLARELANIGKQSSDRALSVGYNHIRFDNEVMRRFLFANGQDPYSFPGSEKHIDILRLAMYCVLRAAKGILFEQAPHGGPNLKLASIADANGISSDGAHDAVEDVRMMIRFAQLVIEQDRETWDRFSSLELKDGGEALLKAGATVASVTIGRNGVNTKPYKALCEDPKRKSRYLGFALDMPDRLEKFLKLPADEVMGMMGRPPPDRPSGWRSASGGNIPLSQMKATSFYVPEEDAGMTLDRKREKIEKSLAIIEEDPEHAKEWVTMAFSDGRYFEPAECPEDAVYDIKLDSDAHTLRSQFAREAEKDPRTLDIGRAAAFFKSDRAVHLGLLAAWKFDTFLRKSAEEGDSRPAIERLPDAVHDDSLLGVDGELAVYAELLRTRFYEDGEPACVSWADKSIDKIREKDKDEFFKKRELLGEIRARSESLDGITRSALEAYDGETYQKAFSEVENAGVKLSKGRLRVERPAA